VVALHGVRGEGWKKWNWAIIGLGVLASVGAALTKPKHGEEEEPVVEFNL
jgi:hypothetical protein